MKNRHLPNSFICLIEHVTLKILSRDILFGLKFARNSSSLAEQGLIHQRIYYILYDLIYMQSIAFLSYRIDNILQKRLNRPSIIN